MVPFLNYDEFNKLYKPSNKTSVDSSSYISVSEDSKTLIKYSTVEWILNDITILSQLDHPNIIKIKSYTLYDNNNKVFGAIAMERGCKPVEMYVNTIEDMKKLCTDISEALNYLHKMGIAHCDIKPSNIVYIDSEPKRFCLIDFGLARYTINTPKGQMIQSIAYTLPFRDYQFIEEQPNSISCEAFALGQTIRSIAIGRNYTYDTSFNKENFNCFMTYDDIKDVTNLADLIDRLITLPENRISINDIIDHPFLEGFSNRQCNLYNFRTPSNSIEKKTRLLVNHEAWYNIVDMLIFDIYETTRSSIRCLFLAIHNMHRSILALSEDKNLEVFAIANFFLAQHSLYEMDSFKIKDISKMVSIPEFSSMLIKVLIELETIVDVTTLWHHAKTLPELINSFEATIDVSYNINDVSSEYNCYQPIIDINDFMINWRALRSIPSSYRQRRIHFTKLMTSNRALICEPLPFNLKHVEDISSLCSHYIVKCFDPEKDCGMILNLRNRLKHDKNLCIDIIRKICSNCHIEQAQRYNIIFGKEKLSWFMSNIRQLDTITINPYTSTIDEIRMNCIGRTFKHKNDTTSERIRNRRLNSSSIILYPSGEIGRSLSAF